jgi:hypothetical protein
MGKVQTLGDIVILRTFFINLSLAGLIAFGFIACDSSAPSKFPQTQPKSASAEKQEDDGFRDFKLKIQTYKMLDDGSQIIRVLSTNENFPGGFEIILGNSWQNSKMSKDLPMTIYKGVVTFRSIGTESDAFVRAIDRQYATGLIPKNFREEVKFTGLSLQGNPAKLSNGAVKIKLFFEPDGEKGYAEIFANFELATNQFELNEKDPEYRTAIVKALAKF